MARLEEISEAIEAAKISGCNNIVIFHCISGYPTPVEQANLNGIKLLKKQFDVQVGLSDHTLGILTSIVAVSIGASVIEKHFTLSRSEGGLDSSFSLEPKEMSNLVKDTFDAHLSLGNGNKGSLRSEVEKISKTFRRSLYFVKDISEGEVITDRHIKRIRPGFGLEPKFYFDIIGKKVSRNIKRGERVTKDSFI